MYFGREKYENIQDTASAKVLAGLALLMLNGHQVDQEQIRTISCELLGLKHDTEADPVTDEVLKGMIETFLSKKCDIPMCEPVFLLRSNPLSVKTIKCWIKEAKINGVSSDRIKSAEAQLERMELHLANVT